MQLELLRARFGLRQDLENQTRSRNDRKPLGTTWIEPLGDARWAGPRQTVPQLRDYPIRGWINSGSLHRTAIYSRKAEKLGQLNFDINTVTTLAVLISWHRAWQSFYMPACKLA